MKKIVPWVSSVLAVLGLSGCASAPPDPQAFGERTVRFACGNGESVQMQFFPEEGMGVLLRSGWSVGLPEQPAEKGFAYSNGVTTVQGKGNEMTIQIAHLTPIWCRSRSSLVVAGSSQ